MSLTAGAGTRCMSLLSSSPSLVLGLMHRFLLLLSSGRRLLINSYVLGADHMKEETYNVHLLAPWQLLVIFPLEPTDVGLGGRPLLL